MILEKLAVTQLVVKFETVYGTRIFVKSVCETSQPLHKISCLNPVSYRPPCFLETYLNCQLSHVFFYVLASSVVNLGFPPRNVSFFCCLLRTTAHPILTSFHMMILINGHSAITFCLS